MRVLDATRVEDQRPVVIKMLAPSDDDHEGVQELGILQRFSTALYESDPANHTVPCLDSFPIPGVEGAVFYVMPLLSRYKDPPFYDLSEINEFLLQLFEVCEVIFLLNVISIAVTHRDSNFCTNTTLHIGRSESVCDESRDLLLNTLAI